MNFKLNTLLFLGILFSCLSAQTLSAQSKSNVFDGTTEITWLGLDFSMARFIGIANAEGIGNEEFKNKYIPAWNELFINEPKKYNVAKAMYRKDEDVRYAVEVTEKANSALKRKFITENIDDFSTLKEKDIIDAVSKYDFQGKRGIGMLFFVEGMSKGKGKAGMWVTFVDMKSKSVLFTKYESGPCGGFGFRNFWARPFYSVLKTVGTNYKSWSNYVNN